MSILSGIILENVLILMHLINDMEKKYKIVSLVSIERTDRICSPCIRCALWLECNIRSANELPDETVNLINECRKETMQFIVEDIVYEDKYVLLEASKKFKCTSCYLANECDITNPFFAKCKAAMNDGNPLVPVSKSKTK